MGRRSSFTVSPSDILVILICAALIAAAFAYRALPSVYFTIALALSGAIRSLVGKPMGTPARYMGLLVFVTLGFFAVSASVHEEARNASTQARADSARAYADSLSRWQLTTVIRNEESARSVNDAAPRVKDLLAGARVGTLRRRVLVLVSDIYDFLQDRQRSEPPLKTDPGQATGFADDRIAYIDSTATVYSRKLGSRVARAIRDLQEAGQQDPALASLAEKPRNPAAIGEIAYRLRALALKLRESDGKSP